MGLRQKLILVSMIVRGVATFGLFAYAMVNFGRWVIENNQKIDET